MRDNNVMRNYYVPNVTEQTSKGERVSDLYSRLLKENIHRSNGRAHSL